MGSKVTEQTYHALVTESGPAVVLVFFAPWCTTCRNMEPILEELAREKDGRVLMAGVDIAESPSIAEKLGVLGVPTLVFLRDGQPVHQVTFTGVVSKDKLSRMLARHLNV